MRKKRIIIISSVIFTLFVAGFVILFNMTGFLQSSKIDDMDGVFWDRENGLIKGTNEFSLQGNLDTCWILIHSYTATPLEMKKLATEINSKFNDFVYVSKLSGHGELPSSILNKSLYIWYQEIKKTYNNLSEVCNKTNVVGSSFGATLALKIAEEHDVKNTYALNTFLFTSQKWYSPISRDYYIKWFSDIFIYNKKSKLAQINDLENLKNHIAYWNMPYKPVKDSLPFLKEVMNNLNKIESPIFIAHSRNDEVANKKGAEIIFSDVSSNKKEIKWYEKSNHILLMDFDRTEVIQEIINFEIKNR